MLYRYFWKEDHDPGGDGGGGNWEIPIPSDWQFPTNVRTVNGPKTNSRIFTWFLSGSSLEFPVIIHAPDKSRSMLPQN